MLTFANPFGFLALLGIPVVLAIHFLQRRSRVEMVTTLFLLDSLARESAAGGRIERIRNSIPLWLQLLMVLLATWLLAGPRWTARESVARVVMVLDSSASMSVFGDEMQDAIARGVRSLERAAGRSEYIVLDSALTEERVFHGGERDKMRARLSDWEPALGEHDIEPALRLARGLAGEDGVVTFVSDHRREDLPDGVRLLAVGHPIANCGFTGLEIGEEGGERVWRALVRNYSDGQERRRWWLETGAGKTEPREITLAPGATETLQGPLPKDDALAVLVMEPDEFELDDRLPLLRPARKELMVAQALEGDALAFFNRAFGKFDALSPATDAGMSDFSVSLFDPLAALPEGNAIVFLSMPENAGAKVLSEALAVENHSLVDGLNWQGLLVRGAGAIPRQAGDEILLWAGERPLILLRERGETHQLLFNFDPLHSNVDRRGSFVVLLHRYLEVLRESKVAAETRNVETGQSLEFAYQTGEGAEPLTVALLRDGKRAEHRVPLPEAALVGAPPKPAHFEILQGDQLLLRAAAHFADAREADFRAAESVDELADARAGLIAEHSKRDPLWRLWVLLMAGAVLLSWWFIAGAEGLRASEASE